MPLPGRMLVVDDEPDIRRLVSVSLARVGIDVHTASNLAEARALLAEYHFDACLTDMRLPDGNGIDFVTEATEQFPHMPIAVITAHGQLASAVEAMRNGAFDFVSKPVDLGVLRRLANQALRMRTASGPVDEASARRGDERGTADQASRISDMRGGIGPDQNAAAESPLKRDRPHPSASDAATHPARVPATFAGGVELAEGHRLVGDAPPVRALRSRIAKVARTNAPIWITGESGTGKELIARLIHANGPRAAAPFVAINCGAIPSELVESELFGHRKGTFTGAHQDKQGLFRAADGGTLFLDEIAELPMHMQVKLLRAVQERSVRPVGESEELPVDVRILSASHADLAKLVESARFRQDLYYRLNVISIRAPALRDRVSDIPALSSAILTRLGSAHPATPELTSEALNKLCSYQFPGNVRELENILERACTLIVSDTIDVDDIEFDAGKPLSTDSGTISARRYDSGDSRAGSNDDTVDTERDHIVAALEQTRWNRRQAAEKLGLTYRQLRYRIARLGLDGHDRAA